MIDDLKDFWETAHRDKDMRWISGTDPDDVLKRLGVDLNGAWTVLEVGPGPGLLTDRLRKMGRMVCVHDIVTLDDPAFIPTLPLKLPVDLAIAHHVMQHVPDHRTLIENVLASLVHGGRFHFDAITKEYEHPWIQDEWRNGTSFPFTAFDLVDEIVMLAPGWFTCRITVE